VSQSYILSPAKNPSHLPGNERLSNLSGANTRHPLSSLVNPDEEHDFSLEAIFDNYGCVSDLKDINLS